MFDINKLEVMDIVFADEAHERFFYEKVRELPNSRRDSEEIAMIYTLGICDKTRAAFSKIVDQNTLQVNPLVLFAGWQTSATMKVTRLAINLYTGFSQEVKRDDSIEGYHMGKTVQIIQLKKSLIAHMQNIFWKPLKCVMTYRRGRNDENV